MTADFRSAIALLLTFGTTLTSDIRLSLHQIIRLEANVKLFHVLKVENAPHCAHIKVSSQRIAKTGKFESGEKKKMIFLHTLETSGLFRVYSEVWVKMELKCSVV